MSFKKYVEHKVNYKTEICINNYTKELKEDLNNLNPIKIEKIKKNLVNEFEFSRLLDEIDYPHAENLKIIVKTNDIKKISQERKKLSEWNNSDKVVSLLLFYESVFYSKQIKENELNKIFESFLNQTTTNLSGLASKIDDIKEKIKWRNHPIVLEAIYSEGFIAKEILLKIGDLFKKQFIINLNSNHVKEIDDDGDVPVSLKEDSNILVKKIFENIDKNKIAVLYMSEPQKKKIENIKKDITLGIKQFLPLNSILSENPQEFNSDIWQVRTDLNKLEKIGDFYYVINEDAPIKWVKKYEK